MNNYTEVAAYLEYLNHKNGESGKTFYPYSASGNRKTIVEQNGNYTAVPVEKATKTGSGMSRKEYLEAIEQMKNDAEWQNTKYGLARLGKGNKIGINIDDVKGYAAPTRYENLSTSWIRKDKGIVKSPTLPDVSLEKINKNLSLRDKAIKAGLLSPLLPMAGAMIGTASMLFPADAQAATKLYKGGVATGMLGTGIAAKEAYDVINPLYESFKNTKSYDYEDMINSPENYID